MIDIILNMVRGLTAVFLAEKTDSDQEFIKFYQDKLECVLDQDKLSKYDQDYVQGLVKKLVKSHPEALTKKSCNKAFEVAVRESSKPLMEFLLKTCPESTAQEPCRKVKTMIYKPLESFLSPERLVIKNWPNPRETLRYTMHKDLMQLYEKDNVLKNILDATSFTAPTLIFDNGMYRALGRYTPGYQGTIEMKNYDIGIFIHESAHLVMHKLFTNLCDPYRANDISSMSSYKDMMSQVLDNMCTQYLPTCFGDRYTKGKLLSMSDSPYLTKSCAFKTLLDTYANYEKSLGQEDKEFIVRYPQMLADGCYESLDDNGKKVLEPLVTYWEQTIMPELIDYNAQYNITNVQCDVGELIM